MYICWPTWSSSEGEIHTPRYDSIPNVIKGRTGPEMYWFTTFVRSHRGESVYTSPCFIPSNRCVFSFRFPSTTRPPLSSHPPASLASQDRLSFPLKPWLHSWAIPPPPSEQEPSASLSLSSRGCRPHFPFEDVILENTETSLRLS